MRKKIGISCIMQRKVYDYSAYSYAIKKQNAGRRRTRYETMRFIAVALICLLVGILLYTNLHKSSKITLSAKKYYAVEVGSFASEATALYFASTIKNRGGAGGVFYDGSYRVFASVYLSKDDAQSVTQKMLDSDLNGKMYVFEFKKTRIDFSDGKTLFLKELANSFTAFLEVLLAASLDYDMDSISGSEIMQMMDNALHDIEAYYEKLAKLVDDEAKDTALHKMQDFLLEQKTVAGQLKGGTIDGKDVKTACFDMLLICEKLYSYYGSAE